MLSKQQKNQAKDGQIFIKADEVEDPKASWLTI